MSPSLPQRGRPRRRIGEAFRRLMETDLEREGRRWVRLGLYVFKLFYSAVLEVRNDRCGLRASALAYKTIISLVPTVAIIMAVLSAKPFERQQEMVLDTIADNLMPVAEKEIGQLPSLLDENVTLPVKPGEAAELKERCVEAVDYLALNLRAQRSKLRAAEVEDQPRQRQAIIVAAQSKHRQLERQAGRLKELTIKHGELVPQDTLEGALEKLEKAQERARARLGDALVSLAAAGNALFAFDIHQKGESQLQVIAAARRGYHEAEDQLIAALGATASAQLHGGQQNFKKLFRETIKPLSDQAGSVGAIGFVLLLYIVFSMFATVEQTFNEIWQAPQRRSWLVKVIYFTGILVLGCLLIGVSLSVTGILHAGLARRLPWARGFFNFVLVLVPFLLTSAVFTGVYVLLPNTKVKLRAALVGGVLAGFAWEVLKFLFGLYLTVSTSYSRVYGALGAIPVLLIWIWLSWVVILIGAEVAFVVQNFRNVATRAAREARGLEARTYYATRIVLEVARRFRYHASPLVVPDLVKKLDLPEYVVRDLCAALVEQGVIMRVGADIDQYLPGKELRELSLRDIIDALQPEKLTIGATPADRERDYLRRLFAQVQEAREAPLKDLSVHLLLRQLESPDAPPEPASPAAAPEKLG